MCRSDADDEEIEAARQLLDEALKALEPRAQTSAS